MRPIKLWPFVIGSALASAACATLLSLTPTPAKAETVPTVVADAPDDAALRQMFEEDRSDRLAVTKGRKSEASIRPQEHKRLRKARKLVHRNDLHSANDYFRAAAIIQRSDLPDEIMLAHDLAMKALDLGQKDAAKVAASAEDRFLRWGIGGKNLVSGG